MGLVLSGGGARGAAHAGALKVLEELRIPIDYIAGTSMGSVVGGLYACGLSPEEIEANLRAIDWDDVFDDSPPRRHLPFRRKSVDRVALFHPEFGLGRGGLKLPAGLVAGQKLGYLLKVMTLHSAGASSFDDLPIPFRAVATDLDTGEMAVLRNGDLAEAMRASMAVPGAFTPVRRDRMTLVDGGLVCNLPVDLVRSMGADIVVAIDISPQRGVSGETTSAPEILVESLYLLMDQNAQQQRRLLGPSDILIVPDLGDMNPADFRAVPSAIDVGEKGARLAIEELAGLSVSEKDYGGFLERQRRSRAQLLKIWCVDEILITGVTRVDPRLISGVIKTETGAPLQLDVLKDDLDRIYELGDFERVSFRLAETDARQTLMIDVREKSWGPHIMRVGLRAEADFQGKSEFTALTSFLTTSVNPHGGEWRTGLQFGAENEISTELYQPMDFSGVFFVSPGAGFTQRRFEVFTDGSFDEEYHIAALEGRLDGGVQLRNRGEIRAGIFLGRRRATTRRGAVVERSTVGGYSASVTIDQLDDLSFPRSGVFASFRGRSCEPDFGSDISYKTAAVTICTAVSRGDHALIVVARGGTSLESEPPIYEQFQLGGFLSLSGYERGQFVGPCFTLGEIVYHYRLLRLPSPFGLGVYAGASLEAGNVWGDERAATVAGLRYAGSVFVGAQTLLGPIYLGFGLTEHGDSSAYISLGMSIVPN
ncbi:patatin-like phospholipase family protein [bacterium]|nr:patatin-like phospholipase family protein [bacterium]